MGIQKVDSWNDASFSLSGHAFPLVQTPKKFFDFSDELSGVIGGDLPE
jgi:hypothetical protein